MGDATRAARIAATVAKLDGPRRLVFGWASVVAKAGDEEPLVDRQADIVDLASLEDAVYAYVLDSRRAAEMHDGDAPVGRLVESFVVTDEKARALGIDPAGVAKGWWVGFRIDDEETWRRVEKGELRAFSIGGLGVREEIDGEDDH